MPATSNPPEAAKRTSLGTFGAGNQAGLGNKGPSIDMEGMAGSTKELKAALELADNTVSDRANAATHTPDGKFAKGHGLGHTSKHSIQARKAAQWRTVIAASVTTEDMQEVLMALMEKAKRGHMDAIAEFFNRTLGKPIEADVLERLAELEALAQRAANGQDQASQPGGAQEVEATEEVAAIGEAV